MKDTIRSLLFGGALAFCILMAFTSNAATQKEIDNTKQKITDLQEQKEEAEQQVDSLNHKKDALETELDSFNEQLKQIAASMNQLEDGIEKKQQEIKDAEDALAEAEEASDRQYADMKTRIQFLYEQGSATVWQMLFEAESIADFLNRTEYAAQINQYDRELLAEFQRLQEQIRETKRQMEEEMEELERLKDQKEEEQASVNSLIANTRDKIRQSDADIENAQSDVEDLEAKIAKMEAYEKELELKKAREDAARLAAIKEQEKEDTSGASYVPADSDAYLLGALIECEAGGESYEGKLAVGSVILNRVKSSYFPNTISGVIYQGGQFSPVASGRLAYRMQAGVSSSCLGAAQEVLNGNITINCLYFRSNNGIISGMVIGNHVFY